MRSHEENESIHPEFDLAQLDVPMGTSSWHVESIDELLRLRDTLIRNEQQVFQLERDLQNHEQNSNRQLLAGLKIAVGIVDELERLVESAESKRSENLESRVASDPPDVSLQNESVSWLVAFRRLAAAAAHEFEDELSIVRVPLLGKDVRKVSYKDQAVNRWVAVRGTTGDDSFTVKQVIRGLWIRVTEDRMMPIQRGEVTT